jgi:mono/diheme cytochrome c family protein
VKLFSNKIFAISCVLSSLGLAACSTVGQSSTATQFLTPTPDPVIQGREVFTRVCAQCHGENGEGYANELQSPALDQTEHAFEHPDQQIHDWIVNGKLGLGRQMPPLGEQLTDDEVHAVIAYLHTLWTPSQLEIQQDITSRWPATPEPGREQ